MRAPRVLRVVENPEDQFMARERESFSRLLLEHLPPIVYADLSRSSSGDWIGAYCPTYPDIKDESGGEVVIDDSLRAGVLREAHKRRRLLSAYAHEATHRLCMAETKANQAHGAVFAAVCAALSARILGDWKHGMHQIGWYDAQDCPDLGLAIEHAARFAEEHFQSGAKAEALPALARESWASALSAAKGAAAGLMMEAERSRASMGRAEAKAARLEDDLKRERDRGWRASLAAQDAYKEAEAARAEKTLGWMEIAAAMGMAALFGAILAKALL